MLSSAIKVTTTASLRIELPANERGLSPSEIERFDKAKSDLLNPRLALRDGQREARALTMASVENLPKQEAERAWQESRIEETLALAEARGEKVDRRHRRILSRDGLRYLYEAEGLTQAQYDTAQACRSCYEARSGDVGSQMGSVGGAGHDNGRFVANRFKRAKKLQLIAVVERAIALQCAMEPACLQTMREVVGRGVTLRSLGSGRAHDRYTKALRRALDVAEPLVDSFIKGAREERKREAEA